MPLKELTAFQIFVLFIIIGIIGAIVETVSIKFYYFKTKKHYKEHHFTFAKYSFFSLFPTIALILSAYTLGASVLKIFLLFALTGTTVEWLLGFFYHKIIGEPLWTYHRYAIQRYTSILVAPLWGFAGVLFYLLSKTLI